MARPQPQENWPQSEGTPDYTDWDSLRHDLESLLHQVENRQLRTEAPPPQSHAYAEPPHHGMDARARHEAALRSVQRAVERFSEPGHGYAAPTPYELETAINEIRSRTDRGAPPERREPHGYDEQIYARSAAPAYHRYAPPPQAYADHPDYPPEPMRHAAPPAGQRYERPAYPPRDTERERYEAEMHAEALRHQHQQQQQQRPPYQPPPAPRNDEAIEGLKQLTGAVSGMASRLERLEADMRATRDASGDITEIAAQVGQLTHVVELIAGAVGEQGHVKKLESQIADLARLYAEGGKPEITALSRRIDELGATVERLAEFQVNEMNRATREAEGAATSHAEAVRAQSAAMHAIEDGVRNIYDRIDTLESSYAVAPEDIERLTAEMGTVAETLRTSRDAESFAGIVQRLDILSQQIDGMGQTGDTSVTELRDDVQALSDAVRDAVEPRFAALESRIESLSSKVGTAEAPAASPSFAELETQIRRLAERMDETGQQLDGLTELYRTGASAQTSPDLEELARLVAAQTYEEMARLRPEAGLDQQSLDALESRLTKVFSDERSTDSPGLLTDVADNLTRVDERLDRLEVTLEALARQAAEPVAPAEPAIHAAPSEPQDRFEPPAPPAMPANPVATQPTA